MFEMEHDPVPGSYHLRCAGESFEVTLRLKSKRQCRAVFRTNLGSGAMARAEVIAQVEQGVSKLARDWHDLPMLEVEPGVFHISIPLAEIGVFEGKACVFEGEAHIPRWAEGKNVRIKVVPVRTASMNTVYTAFVRQFGQARWHNPHSADNAEWAEKLDHQGYTVIPPSGTFRDLIRQLDFIMLTLRFRIIQLLPIHPVPTVYGRMGRFGSAFAPLDFLAVDPALAEFCKRTTPLDQFRELVDAVHSRGGMLFMDLPANHTGWAATLHNHHPEWYKRESNGEFISPGAWGVVWADLVELDYKHPELCAYMAEVFLFWCRQGVDGFRCDAGYMVPAETWCYIVARVRDEYPDTVFLLEGLGGKVEVTAHLLADVGLDWAYSELFQTGDRGAFEHYLPGAIKLSEQCGPLIHFAETHDNNRLAVQGQLYSRMRVALCALLSQQGGFGITNGVEWFATEKVDVHGASALAWDADENQIGWLRHLNTLLAIHPAFEIGTKVRMVTVNSEPAIAVWRNPGDSTGGVLILINLDCHQAATVAWDTQLFSPIECWDLLSMDVCDTAVSGRILLQPGETRCLTADYKWLLALQDGLSTGWREPAVLEKRRCNLMAMRVRLALDKVCKISAWEAENECERGSRMKADPVGFCQHPTQGVPLCTVWRWPADTRRGVVVPLDNVILVKAPYPFCITLKAGGKVQQHEQALLLGDGEWGAFLTPRPYNRSLQGVCNERRELLSVVYTPDGIVRNQTPLFFPPPIDLATVCLNTQAEYALKHNSLAVLSNGTGAMSMVQAGWGEITSQYECLLAVNTSAEVPVDKTVFWSCCRAWLRYRGYSQEISRECLTEFGSDPDGSAAHWIFDVPCGMGHRVVLSFTLTLIDGMNQAQLTIRREGAVTTLDPADEVTVILRPEIEWRSFHHQTKAFTGAEHSFPAAIKLMAQGFVFKPQPDEAASIRVDKGEFHLEPEWRYMVEHVVERERGLEPCGDLFSPGWFALTLCSGTQATVVAARHDQVHSGKLVKAAAKPRSNMTNRTEPLKSLHQALDLFVVRRGQLRTVIAGYPWFLDWGRDTLIVLRGLIAAGRLAESQDILHQFARFEQQGTLPNIIHGNTIGNRDTSDAPLWFCVVAGELAHAAGKPQAILMSKCGERTLLDVILSILQNYHDGTPNGIYMDHESGLIYSPPHFTWMDTNYPAATPREGYPVEIQALWIAALRLAARYADKSWGVLAEQATTALHKLYPLSEGWLADSLRASAGTSALQAEPEDTLRPNQLLAITLGVPLEQGVKQSMLQACERLLVPGAIRSLADQAVRVAHPVYHNGVLLNNPYYPYHGRYLGDEDTKRKPAYHSGTAWTWPFPLYAEALSLVYPGNTARMQALSLLASSVDMLNSGVPGHLPEICDGDLPHILRGCVAQAWGVSELLRVWQKLGSTR